MFNVLLDTKSFYVNCSQMSPFYGPMICLLDIVHHTFTLGELIEASMVVKKLVAAEVPQLSLFTIPEM